MSDQPGLRVLAHHPVLGEDRRPEWMDRAVEIRGDAGGHHYVCHHCDKSVEGFPSYDEALAAGVSHRCLPRDSVW